MATSISNYDLFALVEQALDDSGDKKASWSRQLKKSEDLENEFKDRNLTASNKSKSKKKIVQSKNKKRKEEEYDVVKDEEASKEEEEKEQEEEKEEPTSINLADSLNYEAFKESLNLVRSGHSYDSEPTKTELKDYYNSLTKEEKQVCHILIKGITHVTLMDVKGKSAKTPSDLSFNISRSGVTSKEKKKSLDNRISAEKEGKKVDNNTPIAVSKIKIGESIQDKSEIIRVLNSYK